jgi:predicted dehydrogenase
MVQLGIIGLGKWASVLATAAAQSSQLRIVKGFSRSARTRDAFSAAHGIACAGSADEMLGDPAIEGVILTVPNELHLDYALQCARAGKHVYIEKPIANRLGEARTIGRACAEAGVRVFIGHCAKLLDGVRQMQQTMASGELGEICLIEGHFFNERALALTPDDWRWYQAKAPGGPLSQIAIHQFDVLRYLGGPVASIGASAARRSPAGAEVEDQWVLNLQFESGALGSVLSSWTAPGLFDVRVTGTRATMHYEIDQTRWARAQDLHQGASLTLRRNGQSPRDALAMPVQPSDMFQDELERFAQLVRGTPQPDFDANYGIEILGLVEAARRSAGAHGVRVRMRDFLAEPA